MGGLICSPGGGGHYPQWRGTRPRVARGPQNGSSRVDNRWRETLQTVWERPRNISRSGQVRDRVSEARGHAVKKGNRWGERALSLRHTCRIRGRPSFPLWSKPLHAYSKARRLISAGSPSISANPLIHPVITYAQLTILYRLFLHKNATVRVRSCPSGRQSRLISTPSHPRRQQRLHINFETGRRKSLPQRPYQYCPRAPLGLLFPLHHQQRPPNNRLYRK